MGKHNNRGKGQVWNQGATDSKGSESFDNELLECKDQLCRRWGIPTNTGRGDAKSLLCIECGGRLGPLVWGDNGGRDQRPDDFAGGFSRKAMATLRDRGLTVIQPRSRFAQADDTFTAEPDLKGCPIAPKPVVEVPYQMFNQWIFMANEIDTEWIAYLKGHQVDDQGREITAGTIECHACPIDVSTVCPACGGTGRVVAKLAGFKITEMYFPKQHGTGGHVSAVDGEILPGTIGAVHSHVDMGVFWSGEDEKHANHEVELVVNRKREILSSCRFKLGCGNWGRGEGKVVLTRCEEELETLDRLKEALKPVNSIPPANTTFESKPLHGDGKDRVFDWGSYVG